MQQKIKTTAALIICAVFLVANAFIGVGSIDLSGTIDLSNLFNYENQDIPENAQFQYNVTNPITDIGATLGRVLFYDQKLSVNNSISCASCHQQENAFGDSRIVATGFEGRETLRHPMRLINVDFGSDNKRFWDERVTTLENLATLPIKDTIEMGFSGLNGYPSIDSLITKISQEEYYKTLFNLTFGDEEITEQRIGLALAQFIRSIMSFDSKFDEGYNMIGEEKTDFPNFTAQENRGKSMFFTFPGGNPSVPQTFGTGCGLCHKAPDMSIIHLSGNNGVVGIANDPDGIDLTIERSPSLKDLVKPDGTSNGPFMHDGSLATLDDVIDHYNDIPNNPANTELGGLLFPEADGSVLLNLSDESKEDLKAFLMTFTGVDVYTNEKWSNPFDPNGNLTLLNNSNCTDVDTFVSITLCQGDEFEGYTQAGTYQDTLPIGTTTCNLIRTLQIEVLDASFSDQSIEICDGSDYNGISEAGVYTNVLVAANGCDSIHTLNLSVLPIAFTIEFVQICEGEEFMGYTESMSITNTYTGANGCDSLATLNLSVLEESDPQCGPSSIIQTNINKLQLDQNIVTNTLSGKINLPGMFTFRVIDSQGHLVSKMNQFINHTFELDLQELTSGFYFLQVHNEDTSWVKRFVKI